jgi:hypothetical protein
MYNEDRKNSYEGRERWRRREERGGGGELRSRDDLLGQAGGRPGEGRMTTIIFINNLKKAEKRE